MVRHRLQHEPLPRLLPRVHLLRQPKRMLPHRRLRPGERQVRRAGHPAARTAQPPHPRHRGHRRHVRHLQPLRAPAARHARCARTGGGVRLRRVGGHEEHARHARCRPAGRHRPTGRRHREDHRHHGRRRAGAHHRTARALAERAFRGARRAGGCRRVLRRAVHPDAAVGDRRRRHGARRRRGRGCGRRAVRLPYDGRHDARPPARSLPRPHRSRRPRTARALPRRIRRALLLQQPAHVREPRLVPRAVQAARASLAHVRHHQGVQARPAPRRAGQPGRTGRRREHVSAPTGSRGPAGRSDRRGRCRGR